MMKGLIGHNVDECTDMKCTQCLMLHNLKDKHAAECNLDKCHVKYCVETRAHFEECMNRIKELGADAIGCFLDAFR